MAATADVRYTTRPNNYFFLMAFCLEQSQAGTCTLDDLTYELYPHSIQLNFNTSSGCTPPSMTIPGYNRTYEALQFLIHAGSDHALDDTYFAWCRHAHWHEEKDGNGLAVLGMFLEAATTCLKARSLI
jgi:carbonic anhydrase